MILRSPSELYLLHLLVHPANHTIDQVIERAIETKTVFVGRKYLGRLRTEHLPPHPFMPFDRMHKPSQKYLFQHHVHGLFFPDLATQQCLEILALPSVRSYVETLAIAGVDARTIRDGVRSRFKKEYHTQAVTKYFTYFFNIDYFDARSVRMVLDLEVEQLLQSKSDEVRRTYKLMKKNARHDPRRFAVALPGGKISAHAIMEQFGDWPTVDTRQTVEAIQSMALMKAATSVAIGNGNDVRKAESLMRIASLAAELRASLIDPGQDLAGQFKQFLIRHDKPEMTTIDELGEHTVDINPEPQRHEEEEPAEAGAG